MTLYFKVQHHPHDLVFQFILHRHICDRLNQTRSSAHAQGECARRSKRKYANMKIRMENSPEESEITMDDVRNLIKKKDNIEEQIKAYYDVLEDVSMTDIRHDRRYSQISESM